MQLHVHLSPQLPHLHLRTRRAANVDLRRLAERAGIALLTAYGLFCIVWAFSDSGAPDLLVSLGLYALVGAVGARLEPLLAGGVLAFSSLVGPVFALAARWLGDTYATTLHDGQIAALFAVPFVAGVLLLAAAIGRKPADDDGG